MVATPNPAGLTLAALMKAARENQRPKVSAREVARRMGISHSLVSYWESGKRRPDPVDVSRFLQALGETGEVRDRVMNVAMHSTEPDYLSVGVPEDDELGNLLVYERKSKHIVDWSPLVVPGLLQTTNTARAIIPETDDVSGDRILIRAGRSHILRKTDPTELVALIGEPALLAPIGGLSVQVEQLEYLLRVIDEWKSLTVQIVPTRTPWHPGMMGPFSIFTFADSKQVLHLEHHRTSSYLTDEAELVEFGRVADHLQRETAMSPTDSRRLIADVVADLKRQDNDTQ